MATYNMSPAIRKISIYRSTLQKLRILAFRVIQLSDLYSQEDLSLVLEFA
jgi:hypothetical protein